MRRSIATVSLSGTLPEKIDAIAAAGFDGIELFEPDFTHFAGAAHDLRALCDERGLAIELFQPFRDFEGMPEAQHRRNLDCNRSPCAAATSSTRSARCAKVGCASCRSPATTTTICRAASKSTPAVVERIREAGVLYDRNADGDFLHACTEPFAERLLFEAVQRVGGYDAYGTPNAPARMAALVQQQTPVLR